jgi:hypothetical protein
MRRLPTVAARRAMVRLRQLAPLGGDAVWLVDGRGVRDLFYSNFTEGGHGLRYRFIPRREIWIDDAVVASERAFIVAHEAEELRLMRRGMSYDRAHERALALERSLRNQHAPIFG